MATAPRTRPRAVVDGPRRAAWQLNLYYVTASAQRTIIFYTFFTITAGKLFFYWNDRRSRRVFYCFYSAIFQLTSAKFQTFAYNSRTVGSSFMKL